VSDLAPRALAGVSVLLVEDDDDGREILDTYLRHVGATVRCASTADDGLMLFKTASPAIVLTDIVMQHHDGLWLLNQIRSLPDGAGVPVVALTGRALPEDRQIFRDAGFDAHAVKPVELDDIVRLIATLVRR
jgi:CheY-like chemotaxis protein